MKFLYIIPEYTPYSQGGIATFYAHLLPALSRLGYHVHVLVANPLITPFESYTNNQIQVDCLSREQIRDMLPRFSHYAATPELQRHLATAWAAWEYTRGGQGFDRVETADWGLLFAPWAIANERPPTVVQCHASMGQIDDHDPQSGSELHGHLLRLIERDCLALMDELQTYGRANQQDWEVRLGRPITYIPPAFSATLPSQLSESPAAEWSSSERGLVVGRIQYWKGAIALCEALQQMGDEAPNLDWVGRDTPYQSAQQSMGTYLTRTYPQVWGQRVQALGSLPPAEVAQRQRQASFIVVPSTWDVFNLSAVEGMAQGRVVICSTGAGAAELIQPGETGFVFPAGDSEALADCLRQVQQMSSAERETMGQRAQAMVKDQLQPEAIAQRRSEIYQKLCWQSQPHAKADDWLIKAVSPAPSLAKPEAFLDHLPLRSLLGYCGQRLVQKSFAQVH